MVLQLNDRVSREKKSFSKSAHKETRLNVHKMLS